MMRLTIFNILKKEFKEILNDKRNLVTIFFISVLSGPILFLTLSSTLSNFESHNEKRIFLVYGIEHAPSLEIFLKRQTATVVKAKKTYEKDLSSKRILDPVVFVPYDFERKLNRGERVKLSIISDSTNSRANAGVTRVKSLLNQYASERSSLLSAIKGINRNLYDDIIIEDIELSSPQAKAGKVFGMLPYFFILSALYGVWSAAIETTSGEKDRNTLDSLKLLPVTSMDITIGKWFAVTVVGFCYTFLTVIFFLITQILMPSETLRAMFSFGTYEAFMSIVILTPLVIFFSSSLMLIGSFSKSLKEAQTNATAFMLFVTFLPLFWQFGEDEALVAKSSPVLGNYLAFVSLTEGASVTAINLISLIVVSTMISMAFIYFVNRNMFQK